MLRSMSLPCLPLHSWKTRQWRTCARRWRRPGGPVLDDAGPTLPPLRPITTFPDGQAVMDPCDSLGWRLVSTTHCRVPCLDPFRLTECHRVPESRLKSAGPQAPAWFKFPPAHARLLQSPSVLRRMSLRTSVQARSFSFVKSLKTTTAS